MAQETDVLPLCCTLFWININRVATIRALASCSALPTDVVPLSLVGILVNSCGCKLWDFLILILLWDDEIENHRHEGSDSEASLHDKLDRVEETHEGAVVTGIGEDIVEPAVANVSTRTCQSRAQDLRWNKGRTIADRDRRGEHETVAAAEWHSGDNANTRDSHSRE